MLVASEDAAKRRESFFRILFGDNEGFICISSRKVDNDKSFKDEFFLYPEAAEGMLNYIENLVLTHDIWYCPMLFDTKQRQKQHVITCPAIWADLDECRPEKLLIQPTITVLSSPGRWQGLWKLDEPADPSDAEMASKRIAYYHAEQGADKSGWDLTQLLRLPFTHNYKYGTSNPPMVVIQAISQDVLTLESFDIYPENDEYAKEEIPFPTEWPFESGMDVLTEYKSRVHPNVWPMFTIEPPGDWSKTLWHMEMMLFESGLTNEEVYLVARDSACNKYKRDGRSNKMLWRDVCKASARQANRNSILISPNQDREPDPLLSEEEKVMAKEDVTIVEEYVEWAKTLGDAAWQYHEAGAFIILSSLLSGAIKLPTSFGIVTPNLWFMLLADTTLTRKTTAMDIAMEMLLDVDQDCVLATDGSIEGLFTSLSLRPNRASVFLRDEFSGLLEAMTKKDYMAGMAETLTKLYDGKYQKRVLRKEIIEVKDPILIILAGGIRTKIQQLLQFEHVSSGFMPRFVFVTATSDASKMKPLGPPTEHSEGNRLEILNKLKELHVAVTMQTSVTVSGTVTLMSPRYDAQLTPEAWDRYNKLETQMVDMGLQSTMPEILMPMMDRLAKSCLKASVLIAASRGIDGKKIIVNVKDLIKAISYTEAWRDYGLQVIRNIGMSVQERQIEQVYKAICRTPNILRSTLMQNYHLTKRDTDAIMNTLEERGLVTGVQHGRSVKYTPTKYERGRNE